MDSGVKDIVERQPSEESVAPPEPPKKVEKRPFAKKWTTRRRPVVLDPTAVTKPPTDQTHPQRPQAETQQPVNGSSEPPLSEPERIHLENIRKLQTMTPEEIEREREEIFRSMDPTILESLLRRAETKEAETKRAKNTGKAQRHVATPHASSSKLAQSAGQPEAKNVLHEPGKPTFGVSAPSKGTIADWDPAPEPVNPSVKLESKSNQSDIPSDLHAHPDLPTNDSTMHFPPPPEELRKYFPELPVETEKMAWMQPIDDAEDAEYSSELASVAPSELRFDFKGDLITPRQSRKIGTTAGLHHHGDAPSAAGYTLPELAHLARSSHPGQRAMAIQTVGRVLHKLRLRKFARSSDLQEGLTALVQTTRIMDTLVEAADDSTRNLTVRTLATEALWLANTDNYIKDEEKSEATPPSD